MGEEKVFRVEREQKLLQRNHITVKAKTKKEAIEFAKSSKFLWGNAEFEMLQEKFKVLE